MAVEAGKLADAPAADITAVVPDTPGDPILLSPVVSFVGWAGFSPAEPAKSVVRLFTDVNFTQWLEFPLTAVVSQKKDVGENGCSRLWVKAATPVTRCHAGIAQYFADLDDLDDDDPAAGYGGGRGTTKGVPR